ncbi:hypothetical protein LCGC14_0582290 [marine sediment metagenome]|uniref:Uncharacterized protein n=1 Tax=marine sediment metagenome TaxID=412755 RepID=A0A0F9RL25_9ZZZZ
MAATPDNNLRLDVPDVTLDDNTWGTILNTLIGEFERSITAIHSQAFTSSDVTLGAAGGANEEARKAILVATGALAGNVNFIIPNEPKIYIVWNNTTEDFTVGIKTSAGTRLDIPQDTAIIVWCDGAAGIKQINALTSGVVSNATDSTQLIGVAGANFAQKAVKNQWTKPQVLLADQVTLDISGDPNFYVPDADSDTNILVTQAEMMRDTDDVQIKNPTGTPVDGQILVVTVEQRSSALASITWGSEFKWPDNTAIDLTQTVDKIDAFSFMYNANVALWLNFGTALNIPRS